MKYIIIHIQQKKGSQQGLSGITHNTYKTVKVMLTFLKSSFPENSEGSADLRTDHQNILQILLL